MSEIVYNISETGHYLELIKSKNVLLGAHNLNQGEELVMEFSKVDASVITGKRGEDIDVVIGHFTNGVKMRLNNTNLKIISGLFGAIRFAWTGKSIQVFVGPVRNPEGPGTVPGLIVRERIPDTGESIEDLEASLRSCGSTEDLIKAWKAVPKHLMARLESVKDEVKGGLS